MNYQAAYFRAHPGSPYARLADSVPHPFNEYLFVAVNYGLLGVGCFGVFRCSSIQEVGHERPDCPSCRSVYILSNGVFALFSYPLLYPFTWVAGLDYLRRSVAVSEAGKLKTQCGRGVL